MITNVSLVTVYCLDQDAARDYYVDVLGFEPRTDVTMGEGRQLEAGKMGGLGLRTDDCRKTYAELSAKGVTFLQEPADRPYGVEAVMRDISGNWLVLVEPREFTPGDFA